MTYTGGPYQSAFRQALIATGVSGAVASGNGDSSSANWQEYEMPSLVNHSLDYANEKLKPYRVNKVVIGDGSSIVKQYPQAQSMFATKQNIFLLTDGANITMPDMRGWVLKDVQQFAAISGIPIQSSGSGSVKSQSVAAGTTIDASTEIKVTLK